MHLCAEGESTLKIVWSGNTWSYRDAMDTHEIKGPPCVAIGTACICVRASLKHSAGFYHSGEDENADGKRTYYRMLELDIRENGAIDKLRAIFTDVFHNLAMRVVLEGSLEPDTHVSETVELLKEIPNLHFAAAE